MLPHSHITVFGQTGRSDIPLTERGVEQIKSKAAFLVGDGSMWSYVLGIYLIAHLRTH